MRLSSRWIGLVVSVVFYSWGLQGHAVSFFDDFSDGDDTTGPVTWLQDPTGGGMPGTYDASSGDYVLTPTDTFGVDDDENLSSVATGFTFGDVSLQTRTKTLVGDYDPFEDPDFDASGVVGGEDLLTWQRGFGSNGTQPQGDANSDGAIDTSDYNIWQEQFGGPPGLKGGNNGFVARLDGAGNGYALVIDDGSQWNLLALNGFQVVYQINDGDGPVVGQDYDNEPSIDPDTGSPYNTDNDLMIQWDITGSGANSLHEVWFWRPDQPRPALPEFSKVDTENDISFGPELNSGSVGVLYNEDDGNSPAVFRFMAASDTHLPDPLSPLSASASVPEPTSGLLAMFSALGMGLMRPKREV